MICLRISIHSLRMEGDCMQCPPICNTGRFQSTPSAWRETVIRVFRIYKIFISIHSLRMEGDDACQFGKWAHSISIHSLRMEGDSGFSFLEYSF